MYEDEVPVFRRILWFALWFIVIVAVLWFLVWLIFFRETTPKHSSSTKSGSQSQSTSSQPPQHGSGAQPSGSSGSSGSSSTGSGSGSTPNTLANTGAGDIFVPFGVAAVVGTVAYHVRLRRKLLA